MTQIDFIKYNPPYGGQAFKKKGILTGYKIINTFLSNITDKDSIDSMQLTIYEENKIKNTHGYYSREYVAKAYDLFGKVEKHQWLNNTSSNNDDNEYSYTWNITKDDHGRCIDFLDKMKPFPRYYIGPVQVSVSIDFNWKSYPLDKENFVHDYFSKNHIILFLSNTNSIIMDLIFPFSSITNEFNDLYKKIIRELPVELPINKFRCYIPNKKEDDYIIRKISDENINKLKYK